jgi:fermentation-respiration switch protein FrsA (DUF1100 family)
MVPNITFPRHLLPGRFAKWAAVCLMAVYAITVGALLALEDRLVFHPVLSSTHGPEPQPTLDFEEIELRSEQGLNIHARWFPSRNADGAILYCHSRAGDLSRELRSPEIAEWQRDIRSSVLVFDYPGYGQSSGVPSEAGCYAAAEAAYHWLTHVQGVAPNRILICGRSLGTGVAVELASHQPHRALILIAPFTSLPDVALSNFPLLPARLLMRNRFDSLAKIGRCSQPAFIVHGTCDSVVPFAQGKALFIAANEPKRFLRVEGGRHGNCVSPVFFSTLRAFLDGTDQCRIATAHAAGAQAARGPQKHQ